MPPKQIRSRRGLLGKYRDFIRLLPDELSLIIVKYVMDDDFRKLLIANEVSRDWRRLVNDFTGLWQPYLREYYPMSSAIIATDTVQARKLYGWQSRWQQQAKSQIFTMKFSKHSEVLTDVIWSSPNGVAGKLTYFSPASEQFVALVLPQLQQNFQQYNKVGRLALDVGELCPEALSLPTSLDGLVETTLYVVLSENFAEIYLSILGAVLRGKNILRIVNIHIYSTLSSTVLLSQLGVKRFNDLSKSLVECNYHYGEYSGSLLPAAEKAANQAAVNDAKQAFLGHDDAKLLAALQYAEGVVFAREGGLTLLQLIRLGKQLLPQSYAYCQQNYVNFFHSGLGRMPAGRATGDRGFDQRCSINQLDVI